MYINKLQDIVFQNMIYSKVKKRMNASLYPALLKMPFQKRLCPLHISNQTDAHVISYTKNSIGEVNGYIMGVSVALKI